MAPAKMPLRVDEEEMGKKDDDHRPPKQARFRPMQYHKIPRPRRLLVILLALVLLYLFFKHMPTDLTPARERYSPTDPRLRHQVPDPRPEPIQSPAIPKAENTRQSEAPELNKDEPSFDGEIKFYELARSLPPNKHPEQKASHAVLFAASSLHSVSDLLPLACQMVGRQLNHVHFALMGKDEVSIEGIKKVNGITDSDCPIVWHDSRPNYATESSDARMEQSVVGGLGIIQTYIAPELIITQAETLEDSFFWKGIQSQKRETGITHIALPTASNDLMWIASLDSTALRVWNDIRVDMVVHASQSSGSLIRLIRSLDAADYLGSTPSLTIELPPWIDHQLRGILQNLDGLSQLAGRITLRRRIEPHYMDPADSSLRTVESFYPMNPRLSHLLLLSPQTELAPSFYHYLKYSILHYKQSARARLTSLDLLGISLELPSLKSTTDREPFTPPSPQSTRKDGKEFVSSFLWQAPNSNAALYFGDKWAEFHSFLSSRLAISETKTNIASQDKLISKRYPAFMEYLLEMTRAKGYYMIYPSFPGHKAASLATVHRELYHPPEEFAHEITLNKHEKHSAQEMDDPNQPLQPSTDDAAEMSSPEKRLARTSTIMPLLDIFEAGLPDVEDLLLLSYDGKGLTPHDYERQTREYLKHFRARYGHCSEESALDEGPAPDLFCLD